MYGCFLVGIVLCAGAAELQQDPCEIVDVTWTLGPNMPEFRKGGCGTALGGRVISVFGMRQPWGEMATMYVYDPETNWWQRGPDGPIGQTYVQGTECDGAFYAIGGRSAPKGGVHPECYRLSLKDGQYVWARISSLNEARGWAPSVSIGRKLYVFGAAIQLRFLVLAAVGIINSVIAVFYYFNVVRYMFFTPAPEEASSVSVPAGISVVLAIALIMTLIIGLYPQPFLEFSTASTALLAAL